MPKLRLGARVAPSRPLPEVIEFVRRAEARGVDTVWFPDSHLNYREVWATLGAVAVSTEKINFGVSVTNPVSRHPTVTASAARTVWEASGGRFILGLGGGDSAVGFDGQRPAGARKIRETVETVRALTRGASVRYGAFDAALRDASADVPIYVVASGPRTLRAAGAVADCVISPLGNFEEKRRLVAEGAAEAGREAPPPMFVNGAILITDNPPAITPFTKSAALRLAQLEGVEQFERAGVRIEVPDHIAGAEGDVGHLEDPAEIDRLIGHLVSDEAAAWYQQTYSLIGTQDQVVARLRELARSGVVGITASSGGPDVVSDAALEAVALAAEDDGPTA